MSLSGHNFNQLLKTILESYPDIAELEILIRIQLEENFNSIASGNNDKQKIFKLIQWAESTGNFNQLIKALTEDRPHQEFLQELNQSFNHSKTTSTLEGTLSNNSELVSQEKVLLLDWKK